MTKQFRINKINTNNIKMKKNIKYSNINSNKNSYKMIKIIKYSNINNSFNN